MHEVEEERTERESEESLKERRGKISNVADTTTNFNIFKS